MLWLAQIFMMPAQSLISWVYPIKFDYESRFRDQVMDDFADSHLSGHTPIPCVRCNQTVKFTDLLSTARQLGRLSSMVIMSRVSARGAFSIETYAILARISPIFCLQPPLKA